MELHIAIVGDLLCRYDHFRAQILHKTLIECGTFVRLKQIVLGLHWVVHTCSHTGSHPLGADKKTDLLFEISVVIKGHHFCGQSLVVENAQVERTSLVENDQSRTIASDRK
jgi:hypothetical protein